MVGGLAIVLNVPIAVDFFQLSGRARTR
jgi:hypothetical protein